MYPLIFPSTDLINFNPYEEPLGEEWGLGTKQARKEEPTNQSIITILGMSVRQFIGMTWGWGTYLSLEHRHLIG